MDFKVRFRFNKQTGEVEEFEITDEGPMSLSEAEHNREHDRISAEVGNVIERNPLITEVQPGTTPVSTTPSSSIEEPAETVAETGDERQRQTE